MVNNYQFQINNRYFIVDHVGSGGMADIFLAQDRLLERQVAIKLLKKDLSRSLEFKERFILEAKAAANLAHPNIVTVFDFGFFHSEPFIVMEYVLGSNLKTYIYQKPGFTAFEGLELMIQACAGLGYAHRAGLIHCDVKPQNMLITNDRKLKITDFGISRALNSINPNERNSIIWGSPLYYSPEQANGMAPSPSSDVYSLGIILYEILTNELPFRGSSSEELSQKHREVPPVPPSKLNPKIPFFLDQIVLKLISKEPSSRYRNADQLGRVLILAKNQLYLMEKRISSEELKKPLFPPLPKVFVYDLPSRKIDWGTIGLALLALLFLGGLLPFWMFIYLFITSV
jgi:serine/threonine protein kinase